MLETIFPYGLNDWYDWSLATIMLACTVVLFVTILGEATSWISKKQ